MKYKKFIQWIKSEEGQRELEEAHDRTKEVVEELVKSRKVDQETLYRPFDI